MTGQRGAPGGPQDDSPTPGKVCVRCGVDCSGRTRVKDANGRYTCGDCVEQIKRRRAGGGTGAATPEPVSGVACPNCARAMLTGAVLCTACGYNTETGRAFRTDAGPEPAQERPDAGVVRNGNACGRCGYDLSKLKAARCPECGTTNRSASKIDEIRADSRRIARMAYLAPAATVLIACAASVGILASTGAWTWAEPLVFILAWAFGLAVYFACTISFIGVDEPFPLMALRLLAVYSIVWAVEAAMGGVLGGSARLAITYGVMAISLVVIMDIDWEDAKIVVLVLIVAHFLATAGLVMLLGA